ncbi:arylamine N-acetyltransferase family protein [Actinophytocola sp.]|uniref:arylamine N-acetyltransferase family protein n=1 Tax=Actinophytocola sp. TaxID=1872138 RepID=UPI00389A6B7E
MRITPLWSDKDRCGLWVLGPRSREVRPELVQRYLERIGVRHPVEPTTPTLVELTSRHLESVPFENLGAHLGEQVSLSANELLDKIVHRRRGGICYELNGAFALLLRAVGFEVDLLAGRIPRAGGEFGPPFGHLALLVRTRTPTLVDVGFANATVAFVPWEPGVTTPAGGHGLRLAKHGDVHVCSGAESLYTLETRPRELADFAAMAWWQYNSPHSRFTQSLVCSRAVPGGRRTLAGHRLIDVSASGREERLLDDDEVLDCYRDEFGVRLTRVPPVRFPRLPRTA